MCVAAFQDRQSDLMVDSLGAWDDGDGNVPRGSVPGKYVKEGVEGAAPFLICIRLVAHN
jgi:hypothetical protein